MRAHLAASRLLAIPALLGALGPVPVAAQSITIDGSLAPARTLLGPNYTIGADLGRQVGGNLFHSFGKFGLLTNESANFTGPATVANIIGRVTGGSPSSIDGKVQSSIARANLYLINPHGIVFGPHATVNVSGSFHAATADYVKMSDGARFQASAPGGSTLSAAPPAAFGFLTPHPAHIAVDGSMLATSPGQALNLVGGPVAIKGGRLSAPAGTIALTSIRGAGEVSVTGRRASTAAAGFGPVAISGGTKLAVSDMASHGSGGQVFIRAGRLTVRASEIDADNYGAGAGGRISVQANRRVVLGNGADIHASSHGEGPGGSIVVGAGRGDMAIAAASLTADSDGLGRGGSIAIAAQNLSIGSDGEIRSSAFAPGNAGSISVDVAGRLSIDGTSESTLTGILSRSEKGGGAAGTIAVDAGTLIIKANGRIATSAFGAANAGNISVDVSRLMSIDGTDAITGGVTGIASDAEKGSTSDAGNVMVSAGKLTILNNGEISSSAFGSGSGGLVSVAVVDRLTIDAKSGNPNNITGIISQAGIGSRKAGNVTVIAGSVYLFNNGQISSSTDGSGNGGSVVVSTPGLLSIIGTSGGGITGIASDARRNATGNAGKVTVAAEELFIARNGEISSSSLASGRGGSVKVSVAGQLRIDGIPTNPGFLTGIASQAGATSKSAGEVTVDAGSLSIRNDGQISSSTHGPGKAGNVAVKVAGRLEIAGTLGGALTGIASDAKRNSTGNAGKVTVEARTARIASNGEIGSGTFGAGNGGSVAVAITHRLALDGSAGDPAFLTGISSETNPGSTGNAGNVKARAKSLFLRDNAQIISNTNASGKAGSVAVWVAGRLAIDGTGASPLSITGIGSRASPPSATGDGGSVAVRARNLAIVGSGEITAATFGPGAGGNVAVTAKDRIALSGAGPQITAFSMSTGNAGSILVKASDIALSAGGAISTQAISANGGDITAAVGNLLQLSDSQISTSVNGALGNGGNIAITAPFIALNRSMIVANAFGGNGGNIALAAGTFVRSADSVVQATSQLGISGTVTITGQQIALNSAFVPLPSALRGAAEISRTSCAARFSLPRSSLVAKGRGGLLQDPDMALPALYFAGRDAALHAPSPSRGTELELPAVPELAIGCGENHW